MNTAELEDYLSIERKAFPGKTALLMADPSTGELFHDLGSAEQVPAASTIKTPILLTALEQVRQGQLDLKDPILVPREAVLPDSAIFDRGVEKYALGELLYWMIVASDNTAANLLLDLLGFDAVNEYCAVILGLSKTLCQRKMLDFDAVKLGLDNYTSAFDQFKLFSLLWCGQILTPGLRTTALSILRRQRDTHCFLRYIADDVAVAHKTGSLDGVAHDRGIFLTPHRPFYLGIFTWDCPDAADGDNAQRRYVGRLSKAIFDTYKEGRL